MKIIVVHFSLFYDASLSQHHQFIFLLNEKLPEDAVKAKIRDIKKKNQQRLSSCMMSSKTI